jgi:hypothetical protein
MNGHQCRAILYGDSLILAGVRANLEKCSDLEVLALDHPLEKPLEELGAHCPAAVIFDLSAVEPDLLLSLFQQPGLLLVGIDPATRQALVWAGRQAPAIVGADLVQVIMAAALAPHPPDQSTQKENVQRSRP